MKHKYPIVTVRWYDHWCTEINEPYTIGEIKDMAKRVVRETTGYVVHENKFVLVLCGTIEEDSTVTECQMLMKRGILSRSDK